MRSAQRIYSGYNPKGNKACIRCSAVFYALSKYCYECKEVVAREAKKRYYLKKKNV